MIHVDDKLRFVYLEYLSRFGSLNGYFSFKSDIVDASIPPEIVVLYWYTEDSTIFSTLGMSLKNMEDGESGEMHLSLKGRLNADEVMDFCRFIANFAIYPFLHDFAMDWWSLIMDIGPVPVFPDSCAILIQPDFVDDRFCNIQMGDQVIKFFNIVPLTSGEAEMVHSEGVVKLLDYIAENQIDVFKIR